MDYETANFCFLDTETSGTTDDRGVVEVAWIMVDKEFNILEQVQSLIDPGQVIAPAASGVHGLTNKDVEDYPTLEEFFTVQDESCYGKKLPGNTVVLGHRIGFDTHTIGPYIDGEFVEACSLRWVRRLYPDADDHKLSTLIFSLNLPRSAGAHRAMADAMSALHLARHLCDRTGLSLTEYAIASQEVFPLATVPFGKHKGVKFSEVPKPYLIWMQEKLEMDQDLAASVSMELQKRNKQK
jgi:DNA polymerase III epsilon subunit-like protein